MHIHAPVDTAQDYAINLLDPEGRILAWNEGTQLTGLTLLRARGMLLSEVVDLVDLYKQSLTLPVGRTTESSDEQFGWMPHTPGFRTSRRQFLFCDTLARRKSGRHWTFPQTAGGGKLLHPIAGFSLKPHAHFPLPLRQVAILVECRSSASSV
jgi:hypothetical protein